MGEKFSANPVTGTGSLSVPIYTSPGRSGFGLDLLLAYDSGAGNGPFGFGWSLSTPSIARKTDKGLPQYFEDAESDVFILSGAEDLVQVLNPDGTRFEDAATAPGYTIHRYRPRIEGLFARIERWTRPSDDQSDGEVHWRSISRDNVLSLYGKDENSRIADVVIHLSYSARNAGEGFKDAVNTQLIAALKVPKPLVDAHATLSRLFSLRQEFLDAWHQLVQASDGQARTCTLQLSKQHFPSFIDYAWKTSVVGTGPGSIKLSVK